MKTNPILPKVYVTKYALTQGILVFTDMEQNVSSGSGKMVSERHRTGGYYTQSFHKPFWHLIEADAQAHAQELLVAAYKSAQKKMAKLQAQVGKPFPKVIV